LVVGSNPTAGANLPSLLDQNSSICTFIRRAFEARLYCARMSTGSPPPVLVWFRDDHRLSDNPALAAAAATGSQVLCFYVLDDGFEGIYPLGRAARWWLHGSLKILGDALQRTLQAFRSLRGLASEPAV
jgi:hypothetical protein